MISFKNVINEMNDNLRLWFGKSKVVDKLGYPKVVYHGSKYKFIGGLCSGLLQGKLFSFGCSVGINGILYIFT